MKMKKITAMLVASTMMLSLSACGGKSVPEEPAKTKLQEDVQEYITQVVDSEAEITYFSIDESGIEEAVFSASCIATYQSETLKYVDKFNLTYTVAEKAWELDKITIVTDYESRSQVSLVETTEAPTEAETDAPTETAAPTNAPSKTVEMSDTLSDFTFTLDGVVYQLPFAYTDLTANGWTISSTGVFETTSIAANSYEYVQMAKSGNQVYVEVANLSGNEKTLAECKICSIQVQDYYISDPSIFTIACGINTASTQDEINAAFGTPNSINDYDGYSSLSYDYGSLHNAVKFICYTTDTQYNQIELDNYVADESDATQTSTAVPEYLSEYQAPAELGTDPLSGNVEFGGKVYTLPAPLSEFTADGWKIISKSDAVGSGNNDSVRVERDGVKLYLNIRNFAAYQTIPENCAVHGLYLYDSDNAQITLPGGITLGSDKASVESWITEDFSYYKGSSSYSYSYDDYSRYFNIGVDINIETEKVSRISITQKMWDKE